MTVSPGSGLEHDLATSHSLKTAIISVKQQQKLRAHTTVRMGGDKCAKRRNRRLKTKLMDLSTRRCPRSIQPCLVYQAYPLLTMGQALAAPSCPALALHLHCPYLAVSQESSQG